MCCCHAIAQGQLVSLVIWSDQRSGGRPLGRCRDEGGVEARMSMAWVPGCRRHYVPEGTYAQLEDCCRWRRLSCAGDHHTSVLKCKAL